MELHWLLHVQDNTTYMYFNYNAIDKRKIHILMHTRCKSVELIKGYK